MKLPQLANAFLSFPTRHPVTGTFGIEDEKYLQTRLVSNLESESITITKNPTIHEYEYSSSSSSSSNDSLQYVYGSQKDMHSSFTLFHIIGSSQTSLPQ